MIWLVIATVCAITFFGIVQVAYRIGYNRGFDKARKLAIPFQQEMLRHSGNLLLRIEELKKEKQGRASRKERSE